MEVKEPLKLSIKVLNNKKFRLSSEENCVKPKLEQDVKPLSPVSSISPHSAPVPLRPPLKLTLPKPATYPYSTTPLNNEKEDSKSWFVAIDSSPHVKMKKERGELKVKLAKQPPELPQKSIYSHSTINQQPSPAFRPFNTGFVCCVFFPFSVLICWIYKSNFFLGFCFYDIKLLDCINYN